MSWIYLLIVLIFSFSLFLYSKYSSKKFNIWRKNNKTEFVKNVRKNWKEIRIKTDDCIVINFDTKIDRNSPTYSMTNENKTFYDWMNKDPKRVELIDLSRSKILCTYKQSEKVTKQFSSTIEMDKTIVEFKLRVRDYISIYIYI